MVKENIRIFSISIDKQESESDLSYSQESESELEVQTTDPPALLQSAFTVFSHQLYTFDIQSKCQKQATVLLKQAAHNTCHILAIALC